MRNKTCNEHLLTMKPIRTWLASGDLNIVTDGTIYKSKAPLHSFCMDLWQGLGWRPWENPSGRGLRRPTCASKIVYNVVAL